MVVREDDARDDQYGRQSPKVRSCSAGGAGYY
jgi:hypothetical protein